MHILYNMYNIYVYVYILKGCYTDFGNERMFWYYGGGKDFKIIRSISLGHSASDYVVFFLFRSHHAFSNSCSLAPLLRAFFCSSPVSGNNLTSNPIY